MALLRPEFALFSFLEEHDLPNGTLILAVDGRSARGRNERGRMGSLANNTSLYEQKDIRRAASEAANTAFERFSCALRP